MICQSCGMPLKKKEDFGSNAGGSRSKEYCFHCFQNGRFLDEGITLQEKIEKNVKFATQMGMAEDEARKMSSSVLPKLRRWQTGDRPINPYWFGSRFLAYCVKQGWLKQQGSSGRGTKWYPTNKGKKELKEKFGIEVS